MTTKVNRKSTSQFKLSSVEHGTKSLNNDGFILGLIKKAIKPEVKGGQQNVKGE